VSVANNADALIPLVASTYMNPSTSLATFGVSSATSVSVACVSISS
jgi:hypothetical protein